MHGALKVREARGIFIYLAVKKLGMSVKDSESDELWITCVVPVQKELQYKQRQLRVYR